MAERQSWAIGVHFQGRRSGGPGRLLVEPGVLVVRGRGGTLQHLGDTVRLQVRRFELPWSNHWIELAGDDGVAYVVTGRKRAERILAVITANGFVVERS